MIVIVVAVPAFDSYWTREDEKVTDVLKDRCNYVHYFADGIYEETDGCFMETGYFCKSDGEIKLFV